LNNWFTTSTSDSSVVITTTQRATPEIRSAGVAPSIATSSNFGCGARDVSGSVIKTLSY